jgi:hypothetical protein
MPVDGFYLYEVWRQMIENCLNNKSFVEFIYRNSSEEEMTLGHVWTSILTKVFKSMTLLEIRNLRENNYGQFCCHIQDKILKNVSGI